MWTLNLSLFVLRVLVWESHICLTHTRARNLSNTQSKKYLCRVCNLLGSFFISRSFLAVWDSVRMIQSRSPVNIQFYVNEYLF